MRKVRKPRLKGRETEELQVQGEVHEDAAERRIDEERFDIRDGEVPAPKEPERQQRLGNPALDDDERQKRQDSVGKAHQTAPKPFSAPSTTP